MAGTNGLFDCRGAFADGAVFPAEARLAYALAFAAQAMAGACIQAVPFAAVLAHEAFLALAFHVHAFSISTALVRASCSVAIGAAPSRLAVALVFSVLLQANPVPTAVVRAHGLGAVAPSPARGAGAFKECAGGTALTMTIFDRTAPTRARAHAAVLTRKPLLALALSVAAVAVPGAIVQARNRRGSRRGLSVPGTVQRGGGGDVTI